MPLPHDIIWLWNPAEYDPATLEQIFVQRHAIAERVLRNIQSASTGAAKPFVLFVGPRGIGKTHLLSIVHNRILADEQLRDACWIARLDEDAWRIDSLVELYRAVLECLIPQAPEHGISDTLDAMRAGSIDKAVELAEESLARLGDERMILILAENFDALLERIGDRDTEPGQKALRSFLQEGAHCSILGTAQSLGPSLDERSSPFFGFFETVALDALDMPSSVLLLRHIAELRGDDELAALLRTPLGRLRVRALNALAAGNPRLLAIFSEFLTHDDLLALVPAVARVLDELTPYYQDRMKALAPQQAKIMAYLCQIERPIPVKAIARDCFITEQTASSQLRKLRELGYVVAWRLGRHSYYEIAEPLMRLVLGVKAQRQSAARLVTQFLRAWYSLRELEDLVGSAALDESPLAMWYHDALEAQRQGQRDPEIQKLAYAAWDLVQEKSPEALAAAEEILKRMPSLRRSRWDLHALGHVIALNGRLAEAYDALLDAKAVSGEEDATLENDLGILALEIGDNDRARAHFEAALAMHPSAFQLCKARYNLARYLRSAGDLAAATEALNEVVQHDGIDEQVKAGPWELLGDIARERKHDAAALEAYEASLRTAPTRLSARLKLAQLQIDTGDNDAAMRNMEGHWEAPSGDARAWIRIAELRRAAQQVEQVEAALERALAGSSEDSPTRLLARQLLVENNFALRRWRDGLEALRALGADSKEAMPNASRILEGLIQHTPDIREWRRQLPEIYEVYRDHGALDKLGAGLAHSAARLDDRELPSSKRAEWRALWHEIGASDEALALPLRALDAVAAYFDTGDSAQLLALPQEIRLVILPLLGLERPFERV